MYAVYAATSSGFPSSFFSAAEGGGVFAASLAICPQETCTGEMPTKDKTTATVHKARDIRRSPKRRQGTPARRGQSLEKERRRPARPLARDRRIRGAPPSNFKQSIFLFDR
jgi:hypothetical protein